MVNTPEIYNVLIADSRQTILEAMLSMLAHETKLRVIGAARNADELMHQVHRLSPQVCIVSIDLPGVDVLKLNEKLLKKGLSTHILLVSEGCENSLRKRIMASGINGCLLDPFDVGELVYAVSEVMKGKNYFSLKTDVTSSVSNRK